MATTALIVEIIVIGAFALVWVSLFIIRFLGLDVSLISDWLIFHKDWSTGFVLASVVISYQLGWSVNQLSYFLARTTFNKTIRSRVFKDQYNNFDSIKATVYMQGSPFTVEKVKERLSVVRLTRSAFLNFLLISMGLFMLEKWQAGIVTLGITIILFIQAKDMYSLYCNQIFNAYKVIKLNEEKPNQVQGKNTSLKPLPVSKSRRTKREVEGSDSAR
jgi:hypothetical protein